MGQQADFSAAAIFVQVVDSGSFRGAARVLELPKSNVSRRVAQLEQQLGARLLQRTTRRLQLTEVGAEYYRHASVAVATLLAAERAAIDVQAEPRGPLRVTVPINFGQLFMPAVVADFLQAYPQVELSLELTDRCVDLVDDLLPLLGGRAIYNDSPIIRYWLNLNAARAHVANDTNNFGPDVANTLMGEKPGFLFL